MNDKPKIESEDRRNLIILAALSLVVGATSGLVCALFRLTLQQADWLRGTFIAWAQHEGFAGLLLVIAVLAAAELPRGLAGSPILAGRGRQRHPSGRGGVER